jgi:hypothetical protein
MEYYCDVCKVNESEVAVDEVWGTTGECSLNKETVGQEAWRRCVICEKVFRGGVRPMQGLGVGSLANFTFPRI